MSWFLTIIILCLAFNNLSEAKHRKLQSAVVVGTVYCDTCFQEEFSRASHFISGASVAVECGDTNSSPSFRIQVKTNEKGEFKVSLPFSVTKHVKKIKRCAVKLISSSEPYCAVASTATSSSLHLKSRKEGIHIFSAGFFTFKPLKQPDLCTQKPNFKSSEEITTSMKLSLKLDFDPTLFPPPIQDPPTPFLPPIDQGNLPPLPQLPRLPPLPQLPPLPALPGLLPGFPPVPKKTTNSKTKNSIKTTQKVSQQEIVPPVPPQNPLFPSSPGFGFSFPPNPLQPPSVFPPNPFQPPSSVLPPNPLQSPPSVFPPNPFQPSPPTTNFPPLPLLTPSTPPPQAIPFPFPPFPFQPLPGFPGTPPASTAEKITP